MTDQMTPIFPGMEPPGTSGNGMAQAASDLIDLLREQQLLEAHHVLTVQLVRDLATAIGAAALKGQAAAMALASRELREAMALLPQPTNAGDALSQFMAKFDEQATEGTAA